MSEQPGSHVIGVEVGTLGPSVPFPGKWLLREGLPA
jgi:hypothetical protein